MKLTKQRLISWGIASLSLVVIVSFLLGRYWLFKDKNYSVETSKIDPRLSSLTEPYRHVNIIRYERSNTVGVSILDATGRYREFAVQYAPNEVHSDQLIIVGGPSVHDRPAAMILDYPDNRNFLLNVLHQHGRGSQQIDSAISQISGEVSDLLRYKINKVRDESVWYYNYFVHGDKGI